LAYETLPSLYTNSLEAVTCDELQPILTTAPVRIRAGVIEENGEHYLKSITIEKPHRQLILVPDMQVI